MPSAERMCHCGKTTHVPAIWEFHSMFIWGMGLALWMERRGRAYGALGGRHGHPSRVVMSVCSVVHGVLRWEGCPPSR